MLFKAVAFLIALLPVLATGAAQTPAEQPVVVALGDSIAAGIGSSLPREHAYPAQFVDHVSTHAGEPLQLINLAEPGESASGFLSSDQFTAYQEVVSQLGESGRPIFGVTLTIGGNDVLDLRDASTDERTAVLQSFETSMPLVLERIAEILPDGVPLYVSTIYDPTLEDAALQRSDAWWIARFNDVIRSAVEQQRATLVDLAAAMGDEAHDLTRYPADPHPINAGHERIAREFWSATGLDDGAPDIVVVSPTESVRRTPTLRFTVPTDTRIDTVAISTNDEQATIYQPLQASPLELVTLIDASNVDGDRLQLMITAEDAAGNATTIEVVLTFTQTR